MPLEENEWDPYWGVFSSSHARPVANTGKKGGAVKHVAVLVGPGGGGVACSFLPDMGKSSKGFLWSGSA